MAPSTDSQEGGLPDLRLPIGLFFIVASLIVLGAAFAAPPSQAMPAVSLHADRDCGAVLLLFGLLMAFFGWRAGPDKGGRSEAAQGDPATPSETAPH